MIEVGRNATLFALRDKDLRIIVTKFWPFLESCVT